jgi:hypothetical protein
MNTLTEEKICPQCGEEMDYCEKYFECIYCDIVVQDTVQVSDGEKRS